jgi:large subunit ribosomal protein L17
LCIVITPQQWLSLSPRPHTSSGACTAAPCRIMVSQLIQHERIETTVQKAKEVRRLADRAVTWGKEGTLAARREAAAMVRGPDTLSKLFSVLAERYKEREGGYTRIFRTRRRPNDGAQMAFIEYVDREGELRPARPPRNPFLPKAAQLAADPGQPN